MHLNKNIQRDAYIVLKHDEMNSNQCNACILANSGVTIIVSQIYNL